MSARTSLIIAGMSALGIFAVLMLYAVSGTSDAAYEAEVRRIILQKAGSRASEVKFYRFQHLTPSEAVRVGFTREGRWLEMQYHGPSLAPSGGPEKFLDYHAVFCLIGTQLHYSDGLAY